MNVFEHWQLQKETLRAQLNEQPDLAGVVYQVRHAVLQTEQNALAEISDDVLRQQAGVLMSCIKTSIGLLEANMTARIWVPHAETKPEKQPFVSVFGVLMGLCILLCFLQRQWISAGLCICAAIAGFFAIFKAFKKRSAPLTSDEVRVSVKPDVDRLFVLLDSQMRSADRYLNDYAYLNEQMRTTSDCADPAVVNRAAELLEALYECDDTQRQPADEAARKLLEGLGLQAVDYCEKTRKLFNVLPSKNMTRTLSPAILSVREQRLLKRGTAADCIGAA